MLCQLAEQSYRLNKDPALTRPTILTPQFVPQSRLATHDTYRFLAELNRAELQMDLMSADDVIEKMKPLVRYFVEVIEPISSKIMNKFATEYQLCYMAVYQKLAMRPPLIEGNNRTQSNLTYMNMMDHLQADWLAEDLKMLGKCLVRIYDLMTDQMKDPIVLFQPTAQVIRGRLLPFTNSALTTMIGRQRNLHDNSCSETHPLCRLIDDVRQRLIREVDEGVWIF